MSETETETQSGVPLAGVGTHTAKVPLCQATYDEPRAPKVEVHLCDLEFEHTGLHYCSACGSYWSAKVAPPGMNGPAMDPKAEQMALARMDAHTVGTGFVMVTREPDGTYSYQRVDPELVVLQAPDDGWGTAETDVVRATTIVHRRGQLRTRLQAMIKEADERADRHKGWVHAMLLRKALEDVSGPEK